MHGWCMKSSCTYVHHDKHRLNNSIIVSKNLYETDAIGHKLIIISCEQVVYSRVLGLIVHPISFLLRASSIDRSQLVRRMNMPSIIPTLTNVS